MSMTLDRLTHQCFNIGLLADIDLDETCAQPDCGRFAWIGMPVPDHDLCPFRDQPLGNSGADTLSCSR